MQAPRKPTASDSAAVHARHMTHGTAWSLVSVAMSMAAMLAVGKMVTNALSPAVVGAFMLLLLLADGLNLLAGLGLSVSLPKLIGAAAPEEERRLTHAVLGWQLLVGVATCVALLLLWRLLPFPQEFSAQEDWLALYPHLWLLPLLFLPGLLRDLLLALHAGLNRYGIRAAGVTLASVGQVLLIFLLVWMSDGGLRALAGAMAAAYAASLLLLIGALPRPRRLSLRWKPYAGAVRFSLPLYVNGLLGFLFQRADGLLVLYFLGIEAAAIYEIAKRFPMLLSRTLGTLQVPFLPSVASLTASGDLQRAARLLELTFQITAFLGYAGVFAAVLLQEPLILLLFSPEYLAATPVIGLLMAAICLAVQAGLMGLVLIALEKPGAVMAVNACAAILTLALNCLLLPRLGLAGGGIALLAGGALSASAQAALVLRAGIDVPLRRLLLPQLAALLAAVPLFLGLGLAGGAVALALFVALALAFRVVQPRRLATQLRPLLRR